jgi:hypothetical protein
LRDQRDADAEEYIVRIGLQRGCKAKSLLRSRVNAVDRYSVVSRAIIVRRGAIALPALPVSMNAHFASGSRALLTLGVLN